MTGRHLGAALAVAALAAFSPLARPAGADSCLECHKMQDEERLLAPTRNFGSDIHAQVGLGCSSCHGGNPRDDDVTAMDPDKGFRGPVERPAILAMCTSCHANAAYMRRYKPQPYVFSIDEFKTSIHYQRMVAGDTKAATCIDCHGVHGILTIKDPHAPVFPTHVPATCAHCHNATYMKGHDIPTDQYDQYVGSVHGKALLEKGDLSAPACNDCHGNHGARPPNVQDIAFVCGGCHGREGELFGASKAKMALVLDGKRACVACHGNHGVRAPDDGMISTAPGGLCSACHAPGSICDREARVITARFHAIKDSVHVADSLLALADRRGMQVGDGQELLRQAGDKLTEARVAVHRFDSGFMRGILAEGSALAERARGRGQEGLRDWRNRRLGMAWSLIAILGFAGVLVLKIRRIEAESPPE